MIKDILLNSKKLNASDIHISSGSVPMYRIDGDVVPIENYQALTSKDVISALHAIMDDRQRKIFDDKLEFDFATELEDNLRFRVNYFTTINGPAAAFRRIPSDIMSFSELGISEVALNLIKNIGHGLVLVVGPTGSGKSTTIASFIDYINENHFCHVITIEDPVEFVHRNKKSLINQRELGSSTSSFVSALRSALREDPDVIVVGEMRDFETIDLALTAAGTGHLVFATLHTNSAAQTINRVVDIFPDHSKNEVRSSLASSLKAIISQRLIKKKNGGRQVVFEILLANNSIRNLIREDKIPQITSMMEIGRKFGMRLMKDSIEELLHKNIIDKDSAEEAISITS